jgi:hypothetical protein
MKILLGRVGKEEIEKGMPQFDTDNCPMGLAIKKQFPNSKVDIAFYCIISPKLQVDIEYETGQKWSIVLPRKYFDIAKSIVDGVVPEPFDIELELE